MQISRGKEVNLEEYALLPNPRLKSYFGHVLAGTMEDEPITTPFAKGESDKDLLNAWESELEPVSTAYPSLWKFENDMRAKVGPLSCMQPLAKRLYNIKEYYTDVLLPSKDVSELAIKAVIKEWNSIRGLNVRSQNKTIHNMKLSTNSGLPYFNQHRRDVLEITFPSNISGDYQVLNGKPYKNSAVLGWRGQEGGPSKTDVKQRTVWMFPFGVNICELQMYQPIIESAQRFNLVPAWVSMDEVDRHVTMMFNTKSSNDLVIATDFEGFDQHFNKRLQYVSGQLIKRICAPTSLVNDWLNEVFPVKYNIPMLASDTLMFKGDHGMASGSGGTNVDETLAHRSLQYEAAILAGKRLNKYSQCLGDDGIITYPEIDLDHVISCYSSHGLSMNETKQTVDTDSCVYLRRWHSNIYRINGICVGVYSTYRALGRMRYMERFYDPEVWGAKAVALRQLSILENVKYHPLRNRFVDFCIKRDKYRLGLDIPHFLDDIDAYGKEMTDIMPDFLGYTKSQQRDTGISSWWIVNYLKSL